VISLSSIPIVLVVASVAIPLVHLEPGALAQRRGVIGLLPWLMPVLALVTCLAGAFSEYRVLATVAAVAYIAGAVVLGAMSASRALSRPRFESSELGLAAGWIWVVGGGVWMGVFASDTLLLGFGGGWALLTGAHFHAAGFAAISVTALVARAVPAARYLLPLHLVTFVAVAIGLTGSMWLERVGAALYAVLFLVQLGLVLRSGIWRRRYGWLLLIALSVPLWTMALALNWAYGFRALSMTEMVWLHGAVNAVGHGLLGIVACVAMRLLPSTPAIEAPFSKAQASGSLTPAFVEALKAVSPRPVHGLTDDFTAYAAPGFDASLVHPDIADFYERTDTYELTAEHVWQRGFVFGGRLFARFGQLMGQLGLPGPDADADEMTNTIVDIDDAMDGRSNVRGWVRTWRRSGRTLYVALYSEHERADSRYMNIAFPLPFGSMTSILTLQNTGTGGLTLTTVPDESPSDRGIYLRLFGGRPWRLPLNETITVARSEDGLSARHDMWFAGRLFLRLSYRMNATTGLRHATRTDP
jgi:hypothetical protein